MVSVHDDDEKTHSKISDSGISGLRIGPQTKVWPSRLLSPVHTKHNNYKDNNKDIVLKIFLNIKE